MVRQFSKVHLISPKQQRQLQIGCRLNSQMLPYSRGSHRRVKRKITHASSEHLRQRLLTRGSLGPFLNTTVAQSSEMHYIEWDLRARYKFACAPTRRTRQGDVRFPESIREMVRRLGQQSQAQ